ncbi:MAG: outer membrane beta-barrel protein [Chitinophagaceae bacterium]|nr:outer membrane beta-barrel protein [Chitinophagaceae bacterium]
MFTHGKISCILFLLFLSISAQAKEKFGIDLGVGIKGGLNANVVTGAGLKNQISTDPHAGFFAHLNKRLLGIQIEAVWTQNHIVTDSTFYGIYKQYYRKAEDSLNAGSFKFNTISLPLLLNIKPLPWLWLQVGPEFTANIGVADKNQILKSGVRIINQQDYKIIGGVWVQFGGKAPLIRVNCGLRYVGGLTNINSLNTTKPWQNQMIQLHLGLGY